MSENMDKELDEIMGLINTDHTKRPVTTKQGQHSAKSTPRYAPSESERLRRVSNRRKQQKIRRWAIIGGAVVLLLLVIILIFKGCAGGDVLKGTWDMDGTTVYQFEGNGEGAMILPSNTYNFKYTINEEEKTVSIDFEDEKANDWYDFHTADNETEFNKKIEAIKHRALYDTGITPQYGQQLLTLSTCYGATKSDRIIVIGVESPIK